MGLLPRHRFTHSMPSMRERVVADLYSLLTLAKQRNRDFILAILRRESAGCKFTSPAQRIMLT